MATTASPASPSAAAFDQCGLCQEFFSSNTSQDNPLTPLQGRCGHSFCRRCILSRSNRRPRTARRHVREGSFQTAPDNSNSSSSSDEQQQQNTQIVTCPECQRPSFPLDALRPNQGLCDSIVAMRELMATFSAVRTPAALAGASTPSPSTRTGAAATPASTAVASMAGPTITTHNHPINTSAITASTMSISPDSSRPVSPVLPQSTPRTTTAQQQARRPSYQQRKQHAQRRSSSDPNLMRMSQQHQQQQQHSPFLAQEEESSPTILHESILSWDEIPPPPATSAFSTTRRMSRSSSFHPQTSSAFGRTPPKQVWLYRAVVGLYILFGVAFLGIARGILLPHNLRQVWEQAETMELLLGKARTHQLELESKLEASRRLSDQYHTLMETLLSQEDVWRRQQDDMEEYFQELLQQLQASSQQLQDQLLKQQQQQQHQVRPWRRMVQSVTGVLSRTTQSLGQFFYDYGPSPTQHEQKSQINMNGHEESTGETTSTESPARQPQDLSQTLDSWLATLKDHVLAASVHSISPEGIHRNESMGTRFVNNLQGMIMSSMPVSPTPAISEISSNTTSTPPSSKSPSPTPKSPKRFGWKRKKETEVPLENSKPTNIEKKQTVPLAASRSPTQSPATGSSAPAPVRVAHQDYTDVQPFQIGDHVAQKAGRWKQRHGIVVNVHRLPDRKRPSNNAPAVNKYLVTIASPSKHWIGGRCTRQTGLLKKHEIVAKSPPRSGHYPGRTFVIQYPNELPRYEGSLHDSSTTSIAVSGRNSNRPELVLQRVKFLLEAPSGNNRALFWDLQLLLKQSSWMATWCKTGSWHGMPWTKKKRRRMVALGTGLSAAAWAVVAPSSALFLSLGAVAAGPLALLYIPRTALAMWKESNGKYLDTVFQKWIKSQVRAAKAAAAGKSK